MNVKKIIAVIAVGASLLTAVGCGDKKGSESSFSSNNTSKSERTAKPTEAWEDIVPAADGPKLYLSNTTVKAGEIAEITLSVKDAKEKWSMCGIHVTYDNALTCQMRDAEKRYIHYSLGDASTYNTASVGMLWEEGLPDVLTENNMGCLFFTETFDGDWGGDGDIASFYLKVPDDAKSGTVYKLGFYYRDTDRFSNAAGDRAMEKYVFENWTGGSVTVE